MAVSQKLHLRQSQSLVMTPQLQQAIKLLQLSTIELGQYVESELETNPLLERDESSRDDLVQSEATKDLDLPSTSKSYDELTLGENPAQSVEAMDQALNQSESTDIDVGAGVAFENWGSGGSHSGDFDGMDIADSMVSEISLREHLSSQINIEFSLPQELMIAGQLVESLDEAGYLQIMVSELASRLDCEEELIEEIIVRLQTFDPPGIFARNLSECLKLQLIDQGKWDVTTRVLVDNLELIADGNLKALAKLAGVTDAIIQKKILGLRALQPKPASDFDTEIVQTVIPDVILRPASGGEWSVELNSHALPKLIVNNTYASLVSSSRAPEQERQYVVDKYQSASWLVKALDQRAQTVLKVSTVIVEKQAEFFAKGVEFMRPLVLKDVAEEIKMHESTVSRVTSNKFIATPRGVFELKYFFSSGVTSSSGETSHSAEAIKHLIKRFIDAEKSHCILSDDTIVQMLSEEGIDIARRTVAKYREALRISSSVQRRKQKAFAAA
jgi:RNA polymerase sigma-54 factor